MANTMASVASPPAESGRWELLRALGAMTLVASPATDQLAASLGLTSWTRVEHTHAFVLGLPPYASIYLGSEGKLGGEGADRVAGIWRTLGMPAPTGADHLGAILALYSELGEASEMVSSESGRRKLDHIRASVLWEHLWPWVPPYLAALTADDTVAGPWADLLGKALRREAALTSGATLLPLALRSAPEIINPDDPYPDLLDALVAPVRVGFILTHQDLLSAARDLDVGLRRGERRFIVDALLRQDADGGLAWLARHARRWAMRHTGQPEVWADPGPWWADRADRTARVLEKLSGSPTFGDDPSGVARQAREGPDG